MANDDSLFLSSFSSVSSESIAALFVEALYYAPYCFVWNSLSVSASFAVPVSILGATYETENMDFPSPFRLLVDNFLSLYDLFDLKLYFPPEIEPIEY